MHPTYSLKSSSNATIQLCPHTLSFEPFIDYFWKEIDHYPFVFRWLYVAVFQLTANSMGMDCDLSSQKHHYWHLLHSYLLGSSVSTEIDWGFFVPLGR